jgi:hypothetical protein
VCGAENFLAKISARRKTFVLPCPTVDFQKFSFNNGNRAGENRRIPQYTKGSTNEALEQHF